VAGRDVKSKETTCCERDLMRTWAWRGWMYWEELHVQGVGGVWAVS